MDRAVLSRLPFVIWLADTQESFGLWSPLLKLNPIRPHFMRMPPSFVTHHFWGQKNAYLALPAVAGRLKRL